MARATPVDLATLDLNEAYRILKMSLDANDTIIPSTREGGYLISSKSRPGFRHYTTLAYCDCEGHALRGICRHRVRLSWELHKQRKQARQALALDAQAV